MHATRFAGERPPNIRIFQMSYEALVLQRAIYAATELGVLDVLAAALRGSWLDRLAERDAIENEAEHLADLAARL